MRPKNIARYVVPVILIGGLAVLLWRIFEPRPTPVRPSLASTPVPQHGMKSVPVAAMDGSISAAPLTVTHDLDKEFYRATDYFRFTQENALAAYRGNGRAQYYVANAVLKCGTMMKVYQLTGGGDAYKGLKSQIEKVTQNDFVRNNLQHDFKKCESFLAGDAFAALPARDGGYTWQYWRDRALESHDPLATLSNAMEALGTVTETDKQSVERARGTIQDAFTVASQSNDPNAYYQLGYALQNPALAADPANGIAWMLLACESGFDCSLENPQVGMGCIEAGSCANGATLSDRLQEGFGLPIVARAESRAQEIRSLLAAGDYSSLKRYLKIKS